ncbi:vegetative cell wall protein gp1 isoform X2 [Drosophila obscura]|uniref:vegetative cell wall protein gp1 isoform X2 n=1 Tax=Drosophila obscura TaxID=7282 RepID=UPI001BB0F2CE|nr:vegetative cell wall protein gp1 isoform X2 [Drosophila obscura]
MLRQLCPLLLLVALALGPARCHAMAPQISATRSEIEGSELRAKRGIVTIDLGMILKNLLLKSAQFSSAKASLTHPGKRPTTTKATTTTTTTTAPPVQPRTPPPPRQKPIWQPHGYYSFGYLPFDYETDYGDPVAKAQAQAPQSGSPRRPLHPSYLQRKSAGPAAPARYEYDYDYDAPPPPKPTPIPPPPPSLPQRPHPRPRPRPRPQPRQPLPEPQQIRRPSAQLGDRLVYQYLL